MKMSFQNFQYTEQSFFLKIFLLEFQQLFTNITHCLILHAKNGVTIQSNFLTQTGHLILLG